MGRIPERDIRKKIRELIDYCEASGVPPTLYILETKTGITEEELAAMRRGESGEKRKRDALRFINYREHYWIMRGLADSKLATFSANIIKLMREDGEEEGKPVLRVKFEGEAEEAFK